MNSFLYFILSLLLIKTFVHCEVEKNKCLAEGGTFSSCANVGAGDINDSGASMAHRDDKDQGNYDDIPSNHQFKITIINKSRFHTDIYFDDGKFGKYLFSIKAFTQTVLGTFKDHQFFITDQGGRRALLVDPKTKERILFRARHLNQQFTIPANAVSLYPSSFSSTSNNSNAGANADARTGPNASANTGASDDDGDGTGRNTREDTERNVKDGVDHNIDDTPGSKVRPSLLKTIVQNSKERAGLRTGMGDHRSVGNDSGAGHRTSASCSNSTALHRRINGAFDPDGYATPALQNLRGVIDDVLTREECRFIVDALKKSEAFVEGNGYDHALHRVEAGYAGLGLNSVATNVSSSFSFDGRTSAGGVNIKTRHPELFYRKIIEFRARIRARVEASLHLCPGTLEIDFTLWSQQNPTSGDASSQHAPRADNCDHAFVPTCEVNRVTAKCDTSAPRPHRYDKRLAASVLYLNSEGYEGGEFYFADLSNGEPALLVRPKPGRLIFFTAGPENLHGALPVKEQGDCDDNSTGHCPHVSAQFALTMWYASGDKNSHASREFVPLRIAVDNYPQGKDAIASYFIQHHSWELQVISSEEEIREGRTYRRNVVDTTIRMVIADQMASIVITFDDTAIVVVRDGTNLLYDYVMKQSQILTTFFDALLYLSGSKTTPSTDGSSSVSLPLLEISDNKILLEARNFQLSNLINNKKT